MKRSSGISIDEISLLPCKVFIFQNNIDDSSKMEINSFHKTKKLLENNSEDFFTTTSMNEMDIIGAQMDNLQGSIKTVLYDAELNNELNQASCNFIKRPGHIYHLYERFPGNKYLSILSPEEWKIAPHKYIGSWKLQEDYTWIDPHSGKYQYGSPKLLNQYNTNMSPNYFNSCQFQS